MKGRQCIGVRIWKMRRRPKRNLDFSTSMLCTCKRLQRSIKMLQNYMHWLTRMDWDAPNILVWEHPCSVLTAVAMENVVGRPPEGPDLPGHGFV